MLDRRAEGLLWEVHEATTGESSGSTSAERESKRKTTGRIGRTPIKSNIAVS